MTVTVRLFARARDIAGADRVSLELPAPATAADVRRLLAEKIPSLLPLLERSALAIDGEFSEPGQPLSADAEIALLPPVSGG